MKGWKEYRLGEVARFINGRAYKATEFKESGTPIVRIQNLTGVGNTVYSNLELPADKYIQNGDLIYAWSATFGPYIWKGPKSIFHYHIWKIQCTQIDKYFLYYHLLQTSDSLKESGNGTLFIHITKELMESFPILLPPLPEQKAIAAVLSSLDDKIDLLHRQNKTLEAMAETMFRQWFVEEADEGCNLVALGSVIETTSGGTPSRGDMNYYNNGIIPWVKSKELNGSFIIDTEEKITEDALRKSSAKILPEKSVLIAMYGATVGEYGIISKEMTCNQAVCALIPNENYPYTFLILLVKTIKDELINMAVGSAQQNISQQLIKQVMVLSDSDKITSFHFIVKSYFSKIESNIIQIRTLEKLRDTLLPKLMSGEVRVKL